MTEDNSVKILLTEYQEAGILCRQSETHCRVATTTLVALSTAIMGIIKTTGQSPAVLFFGILGILGSCVTYRIIQRSQVYYGQYLSRAKEIEDILLRNHPQTKISLYTNGAGGISPKYTNKDMLKHFSVFIGLSWLLLLIVGF